MKSNEEFIAGIYEKAAVYTEEKETNKMQARKQTVAKITRIAAMAAVCLGLAGAGALVLGRNGAQNGTPEQTAENYGVAMLSLEEEPAGPSAQSRMTPVAETVTFTGVVESIETEENRIWLRLTFDETAPASAEGSVVCIKWDMLEKMSEEIAVGTSLTASGALSMYENEASEYNGCAELILTDMANLEIK